MSTGNRQQRTAEDRQRAREERERRRDPAPAVSPAASEPAPPVVPLPAVEYPIATEPLHPIAGKLPPEPPLPPRISPPQPSAARRGGSPRWARAGIVLALVVVVLGGGALALVLAHSKPQPKPVAPLAVVRVTIPEGETRLQIAQIATAKGLTGSYLKAARGSSLLDPAHYGAPRGTQNLEGFLFPATYELYAGTPARRLVAEQLTAFEENFGHRRDAARARAARDALPAADRRLDDRTRGAAARPTGRRWRPSSTTACASGCRWGSTRRSATR